jgi:hypothetical protein
VTAATSDPGVVRLGSKPTGRGPTATCLAPTGSKPTIATSVMRSCWTECSCVTPIPFRRGPGGSTETPLVSTMRTANAHASRICEVCGSHGDALTPFRLVGCGGLLAAAIVHLHSDNSRSTRLRLSKLRSNRDQLSDRCFWAEARSLQQVKKW